MGFDPITLGLIGAASSIVGGVMANQEEKLAQRDLMLKQNQEGLIANDQQIQRIAELRYAQQMNVASASAMGRDAFASGSLRAARNQALRQATQDLRAINLNKHMRKAELSTRIQASKARGRNVRVQSLFAAAGSVIGGKVQQDKLKTPEQSGE